VAALILKRASASRPPNSLCGRNQFPQEPKLLRPQFGDEKGDAGRIAVRPGEAGDQPECDRPRRAPTPRPGARPQGPLVNEQDYDDGAQNQAPIGNLKARYRCILSESFHGFPPNQAASTGNLQRLLDRPRPRGRAQHEQSPRQKRRTQCGR
jgi:hypothetical protein